MGKMNRESMGDSAPSRAAYMDVGRFRLTASLIPGKVWIRDMASGEAGSFDAKELEAAVMRFWGETF